MEPTITNYTRIWGKFIIDIKLWLKRAFNEMKNTPMIMLVKEVRTEHCTQVPRCGKIKHAQRKMPGRNITMWRAVWASGIVTLGGTVGGCVCLGGTCDVCFIVNQTPPYLPGSSPAGRELGTLRHLYHLWSGVVLFANGLGLVINVYCKLQGNHLQNKIWSKIQILREERKQKDIKFSQNQRRQKKKWKTKIKPKPKKPKNP